MEITAKFDDGNGLRIFGDVSNDFLEAVKIAFHAVSIHYKSEKGVIIQCDENHPKSGDSVGLSSLISFYSLFTSKTSPLVAATGAVDLDGNVSAIGGVGAKCLIAQRFGLPVLLPEENRKDFKLLDNDLRSKLQVAFITNVSALPKLFENFPNNFSLI